MDRQLLPPPRFQVFSTISISQEATWERLNAFIQDLEARNALAQGGNTAVTVQLQKLTEALKGVKKKRTKKARYANLSD